MRIIVCGVVMSLLMAASGAEAGIFSRIFKRSGTKRAMPKAIDWPIVRPKLDDTHKPGKRTGRHPEGASLTLWVTLDRA